jgi:hypothetical protein
VNCLGHRMYLSKECIDYSIGRCRWCGYKECFIFETEIRSLLKNECEDLREEVNKLKKLLEDAYK